MWPWRPFRGNRAETPNSHRIVDDGSRGHEWCSRRELNDRTGLDVAAGADVMADAGGHWAERFALVVPVGVDDGDRQPWRASRRRSGGPQNLFRPQRELRFGFGSHGTIGVKPDVVDAHVDQSPQPGFRHQVVDVGLADAGGDAGDQPCRRQVARPARVLFRTFGRPRRSSLTISVPSMLISGVRCPAFAGALPPRR